MGGVAHRVSAFVSRGDNRMVFLKLAVEKKSKEIVHPPRRRPPHPQRPRGGERREDICRSALNLLERDASVKVGIKIKRLKARSDHEYRLRHISP